MSDQAGGMTAWLRRWQTSNNIVFHSNIWRSTIHSRSGEVTQGLSPAEGCMATIPTSPSSALDQMDHFVYVSQINLFSS
ncbi:hypothetical protein FRB93_012216 [Tulasnella sp. JGI-2019a]|nr:hypothetical protein FRB93_012216 [Tulasnella sp. JGI-2019a]